jgi:hypothetical protein
VKSVCDYLAITDEDAIIYGNAPGCNSELEVEVACQEGVDDNDRSQLIIYPNPASDMLFIESAEEKIESIIIFDSKGEEVTRRQGDREKAVIRVDGLEPGIYLVRVETESGVVGRKVVVRR